MKLDLWFREPAAARLGPFESWSRNVLPLADETRRPAEFPSVTALIIGVNLAVFIVELVAGDPFINAWAARSAEISSGHRLGTLLTSMFMHASWSHIVGNMVFLWAFGPQIEDAMGKLRYAAFYLAGGVVASLAEVAVDPSSTVTSLGASGAIAAVMGAFLVTYPRDQIRTVLLLGWFARVTFMPAVLLIGLWLLTQFVSLGTVTEDQSGGVAYMAHIGGAIFGAATARLFERPRSGEAWR
jgi:membrane associated rhomboid family serine protease